MRRKYGDCQRKDGNCTQCSLVNYGQDCHNRPITKLEWARLATGLGQKELAQLSGVNVRYIQNIELGKSEAKNMTAQNIIAIAKALKINPEKII